MSVELPERGRVSMTVELGESDGVVLKIDGALEPLFMLDYDPAAGSLSWARREPESMQAGAFTAVHRVPHCPVQVFELTIWLDGESLEIFAEGGTRVVTALVGSLRGARLDVTSITETAVMVELVTDAAGDILAGRQA